MLTRIEIDGFKTFRRFALDVRPFNVIAGANASGKSNLFDAIQFLSRLAQSDLRSAASSLRGEPDELFHRAPDGTAVDRMEFAVEVLVEPTVRDPWGQVHELIQTRIRYEVCLERREERGLERLYVRREAARPIRASADAWAGPYKKERLYPITSRLRYNRQAELLDTKNAGGEAAFRIGQDGNAGRQRPAVAAEATVLSSITSAEFKHLFALREELRSWRFLQLDPAGLRTSVDQHAPERLEPSGWNLAAVLARLRAETRTKEDDQGVLTDLSASLAHLVPGITGVTVREDLSERKWQASIRSRASGEFSSRVASDGTLRLLALITALTDPRFGGLVCFEEPENGVHPARIRPLIEHLRELVAGEDESQDADNDQAPLLQLILTTHSPVVVATLRPGEGIFFESATSLPGNGTAGDVMTKARVMRREIQQTLEPQEVGDVVTHGEVQRYLATVEAG
ncbi:MAG: AAA family ATPase [Actinomycetota bacterium]|nr:AAA family ATPase [Actinomycetota bacterium]